MSRQADAIIFEVMFAVPSLMISYGNVIVVILFMQYINLCIVILEVTAYT